MVSSTVTPPSQLVAAAGDLVFRVCGSTRHGQVVRLRSAKCTIGSGPRCTLRLRARGVRPIHCLILRGPGATVVRRWSPDTRLNDQAFADAELVPGDRLSIGKIELEVLELGQSPDSAPTDIREARVQRLDRKTAQLQAEREALQDQRRELEQQHEQWQAEHTEAQEQLRQRTEELNARGAELDGQREALEEERRQWDAGLAATEGQFNQRSEQSDARQGELEAGQAATGSGGSEPAAEPEQVDGPEQVEEPDLQETPQGAPVDLADVFRRMGSTELLSDDEQQEEPEPASDATACQPSTPSEPDEYEEKEEESIDDYMSRLMERIHATTDAPEQGDQPQVSRPPRPAEPASQADSEADSEVSQPDEPTPSRRAIPRRRKPVDLSPRAVAPEKLGGLSAMRELANMSAHTAIDRHARRQMVSAKRSNLLVAIAGLVVGGALLWMWWAMKTGDLTFYSAMVSSLVALFWGVRYAVLTGRLIVSKSGRLDWKSSKGEDARSRE